MADKFKLHISVEIRGMSENGGYTSEALSVREEFVVSASGFAEVAAILGKFHDLSQRVSAEKAADEDCDYYQANGGHHSACCPVGRRKAGRT